MVTCILTDKSMCPQGKKLGVNFLCVPMRSLSALEPENLNSVDKNQTSSYNQSAGEDFFI